MKQQTSSGISSVPEDLSTLIDEYGDLQASIAAFKPKVDRAEFLRKDFQARFESKPPGKQFLESGKRYDLVVTECSSVREFKPGAMAKLAKMLGKLFWPLCRVTMKDFDDHVALPQRDLFVTESQTGSRRMKAILKAQVKAA